MNCVILIDGTWQHCGYSSLHGFVAELCKKREVRKRINNPSDFEYWKAMPNLSFRFTRINGSCRSSKNIPFVQKYNLRYTKYLVDGDLSSFSKVVEIKPYGDYVSEKLECIG